MRIAAVIAEYDPFHNGHAYHLHETRAAGADAVVAIMSGNFVQRGEPAMFNKWVRAEAAARCGADLVVELPLYWAAARAQRFAEGGVSIAHRLGCIDLLSFGSESGDFDRIRLVADALAQIQIPKDLLDAGLSFAAAREQTLRSQIGDAADVLAAPNDTLAVEYCMAAKRFGASFDFLAVPRAVSHDGTPVDEIASASYIRRSLPQESAFSYCPAAVSELLRRELREEHAPADLRKLERMLLTQLRCSSAVDIASLPDVSEGLENRILSAAKRTNSLEALCEAVKSKRYPYARIRRILLSFLLGVRECDIPKDVPYLHILAIGERGEEILRKIKQSSNLPILTKRTHVSSLGVDAERVFRAECAAAEYYAAMQPKMGTAGSELTTPIFVL